MSKRQLIIVGAGGFGRELHSMLWDCFSQDQFAFKGFLADSPTDLSDALGPVLDSPNDYHPQSDDRFLLAIGSMPAREAVITAIRAHGGEFVSFIHPLAYVAATSSIATGAVIYPHAVVSNRAELGEFVHLNYYASAGHDTRIGRCCLLAPYATLNGMTTLEDYVYLSTHATVVVGRRVGTYSKVSANSTVQHDVPPRSLVFGVPGKITRMSPGLG